MSEESFTDIDLIDYLPFKKRLQAIDLQARLAFLEKHGYGDIREAVSKRKALEKLYQQAQRERARTSPPAPRVETTSDKPKAMKPKSKLRPVLLGGGVILTAVAGALGINYANSSKFSTPTPTQLPTTTPTNPITVYTPTPVVGIICATSIPGETQHRTLERLKIPPNATPQGIIYKPEINESCKTFQIR